MRSMLCLNLRHTHTHEFENELNREYIKKIQKMQQNFPNHCSHAEVHAHAKKLQ